MFNVEYTSGKKRISLGRRSSVLPDAFQPLNYWTKEGMQRGRNRAFHMPAFIFHAEINLIVVPEKTYEISSWKKVKMVLGPNLIRPRQT